MGGETPNRTAVAVLNSELKMMPGVPLVGTREFQAKVLPLFAKLFLGITHGRPEIIDPENTTLPFLKGTR